MSKLEDLYHRLCRTPSDINLLLPDLMNLVAEVSEKEECHVTEFGTRHGWSTVALLMGNPHHLISYDIEPKPADFKMITEAWRDHQIFSPEEDDGLEFRAGNTLEIEIEETDILFIDTLHTGHQLEAELNRHHKKVRKYIAMHDLVSYGLTDEHRAVAHKRDYQPGLFPAVMDFLCEHQEWRVHFWNCINNGLLVLRRDG